MSDMQKGAGRLLEIVLRLCKFVKIVVCLFSVIFSSRETKRTARTVDRKAFFERSIQLFHFVDKVTDAGISAP